jgi:ABC-type dipeptide/oligopeptide/nickel transport system ATPase component
LCITHDLGVVRQIADRTAVMNNGVLVEEGPTETIFDSPQDSYTVELLDAALDISA